MSQPTETTADPANEAWHSPTSPESQGIPSRAILSLVEALDREIDAVHGLVLIRHGHCLARGWWYPHLPDDAHMLYSLTKSFTSTAVGFAVGEGRLSVDDFLVHIAAESVPEGIGEQASRLRVRDLLTMTVGHATDHTDEVLSAPDGDMVRAFLTLPVRDVPGTRFLYNTAASCVLADLVRRVTGKNPVDYLRPRLFEPLGLDRVRWHTANNGTSLGGFGMALTTEDVARFGQFYLQRGEWNGQRLLPASWIETATARQVSTVNPGDAPPDPPSDWDQGYGYQFWRCQHGAGYRADGAFGQFCLVLPAHDLVLALNSGTPNAQDVLDSVWRHLLPALGPDPLPEDPETWQALERRLRDLRLPALGQGSPPRIPAAAREVSGVRYLLSGEALGSTGAIRFHFDRDDSCRIVVDTGSGDEELGCGVGTWMVTDPVPPAMATALAPVLDQHASPDGLRVAISGAWTAERVFVARFCLPGRPVTVTATCHFEDGLRIESEQNVAFGPRSLPTITAIRAG